MPYIKSQDRTRYNILINEIIDELNHRNKETIIVGELNYVISSIIWDLFGQNPSYTNGNNLIGVLECVKQEFYRRQLSKLEDKKIIENGDI